MNGLRGMLQRLGRAGRPQGVTVPAYLSARAQGPEEVERRFHRELLLRNGVYRTTGAHRLDDTHPLLVAAAGTIQRRPLRLLDVACSMGLSTVEMHRALAGAGVGCETFGTDYIVAARYVARGDGCGLLFDGDGNVLQVDVGDWASPWRWRRSDRVLRPGLVARARRLVEVERDAFAAALRGPVPGLSVATVSMLHGETEAVQGLRFGQENILEPRLPGPFDIIRAANLLNGDYFGQAQLLRMVESLRARLAEGGCLLVARNLPGETRTRATLFRHHGGRLVGEAEINGGSEIATLLR